MVQINSQGAADLAAAGYGSASSNNQNGGLTSPSGTGASSQSIVATEVVIGVSAQVFRVECWGLKPSTVHRCYLLSTDVGTECAPILANGTTTATYAYGSPLITDTTGSLTFDYAFKPEHSPFTTKFLSQQNVTVAIIPFGQQQLKVTTPDGSSYAIGNIESKPGV